MFKDVLHDADHPYDPAVSLHPHHRHIPGRGRGAQGVLTRGGGAQPHLDSKIKPAYQSFFFFLFLIC